MPIGKIPPTRRRGYKLTANDWNALNHRVARVEAALYGGRKHGVQNGSFSSDGISFQGRVRVISMTEHMGPESDAEFLERNASVNSWDTELEEWGGAYSIGNVTDIYDGFPIDSGQRLPAFYHEQSGFNIPIPLGNMRMLKTVADTGGGYPEEVDGSGNPTTKWPYAHVTVSFTTVDGTYTGSPTATEMTGSATPHGGTGVRMYVINLAPGINFIPQGTLIPAWFHNGQWFTYFQGAKYDRAVLSAALSSSGAVNATVQEWDGTAWVNTTTVRTVRAGLPITEDIASGKVVWIVERHDVWFVIAAEC